MLGQKIIESLENFLVKLRTGEPIKATRVRREETPDGLLHTFEKVELKDVRQEDGT